MEYCDNKMQDRAVVVVAKGRSGVRAHKRVSGVAMMHVHTGRQDTLF